MIRSELVARLAARYAFHNRQDAERIVAVILETMITALGRGGRIELRGFGAFSVKTKPPRTGRNPRHGTPVELGERRLPYFRCGKEMRERLNKPL
jgi:integration host factor subunit beta